MSTESGLVAEMPFTLREALTKETGPEPDLMVSLPGSMGEAIAATRRVIYVLRDSEKVGEESVCEVIPLERVSEIKVESKDLGGVLKIVLKEGGESLVHFPTYENERFTEAARALTEAKENPPDEPAEKAKGEVAQEGLLCPICGASRERAFVFCSKCGGRVKGQCSRCGAPTEEGWQYCTLCGNSVSSGVADLRATAVPGQRPRRTETTPVSDKKKAGSASAESCSLRGVQFFENDDFARAAAEFRKAVETEPGIAKYRLNLAVALGELGKDEGARAEYEKVLDLDPTDTTALMQLGYILSSREKFDEARESWEKILELAPNTAEAEEARINLANIGRL